MAKVVIFRESGNAVNEVEAKKMEAEFKREFDKIQKKFGLDMVKVHAALEELDKKLQDKYEVITEIDCPKSRKQLGELIETYGKIEVGIHPETKQLYFRILDIGF